MFRVRENRSLSTFLALAGLALLSSGSGCCFTGACRTGGYAMDGGMLASGCDSCGGGCSGESTMFPGSCGSCVGGSGGGLSGLALPLLSTRLACGSGCGGVYWNEWVSDPPDCCDPCNDGGCWVGPRCGGQSHQYGCGLLSGGPIGVVQGAVRGVTGFVGNVFHTGIYGYPSPGIGCASGNCGGSVMDGAIIDEGQYGSGGCSSCGSGGCSGGCAANTTGESPAMISHAPMPQVRRTAAEASIGNGAGYAKPPHRVVTKRLRR